MSEKHGVSFVFISASCTAASVQHTVCMVTGLHLWCLECMYGAWTACMVPKLYVWCLECMYGAWTVCMVPGLHLWCLDCMYGALTVCMVPGLHLWCLDCIYGAWIDLANGCELASDWQSVCTAVRVLHVAPQACKPEQQHWLGRPPQGGLARDFSSAPYTHFPDHHSTGRCHYNNNDKCMC